MIGCVASYVASLKTGIQPTLRQVSVLASYYKRNYNIVFKSVSTKSWQTNLTSKSGQVKT